MTSSSITIAVHVLLQALITAQVGASSPADQFKSLLKEYQTASSGGDGTDEGRKKLIARLDSQREGISRRFLELAQKHPDDPIAVDALLQSIWMVSNNAFSAGGKDNPSVKAMAHLLRDHIQSAKIGPICLRINAAFRAEHEVFLRTVLEKSPHPSAQALACLALGQFLNNRTQRLEQIEEQPALAKHYDDQFGKEFIANLRRQDRTKVSKEIESLFERARAQYAAEKIPYEGTVGAKVKAELFEFRNLLVGKTAPDIDGVDQDGKRFKLSDYRGKVVLLDFWNQF